MKRFVLLFIYLALFQGLNAQMVVENPNVAEQTHLELKLDKISFYNDSTVINLTIENKRDFGGWFCTDKNTYIEDPSTKSRYKLIKTRGIPNCPAAYNFVRIGETINFFLVFPTIVTKSKLLNLIEDCDKECFRFKGIILDRKLNDDINMYTAGVDHYAANRANEAIECFIKVVESIPEFPTHVYGYSYFNLIRIYSDKGDKLASKYWLDQLERSSLPDKQYFIDALKKEKAIRK